MKQTPLLLLVFLLTCCTTIEVQRNLKDVESYIAERPDSALAVLESIDRSTLKTESAKAHHALLHAMALDKNYINVSDDSLASTAVNYYRKRGPKKNLVRSRYYLGLSYFYDKQYDKAIIELSKAEPIAAANDSLYLGFIKMLQAEIYNINYNNIEERNCIEQALRIYSDINAEHYITIAKHRLAQSYIDNKQYDKAESLLIDLINTNNEQKNILAESLGDYAFMMGTKADADYEKAVLYYDKTAEIDGGKYLSKQDYWIWAHALAETGDFGRSQQIVDLLSKTDTSGTAYYWQYEIARIKGNTEDAFDLLRKFSSKNDEEVINILKQSISVIQRDYYQSQYTIADYKARNRNTALIFVIISSLLVIIIIYLSAIQYKHRKDIEKEGYIRYAEEVSRQLKDFKTDTYPALQKKYIAMYKTKYETLKTLFDKYVQSEGRVDAESMIYRQVVALIKDLRKEIENGKRFERTLDADLNGVMTNLRTEFPKLKQKDYALFGYLALGFDTPIISHFVGCSPNSVYISKSRLKKLIEESDAEHKSEFLEIII